MQYNGSQTISNPSFVESRIMQQSHRMDGSMKQSVELSNRGPPPIDFNKLSQEQQILLLTWSQKQQEEQQNQQGAYPNANLYQTQFQTIGQPLSQSQLNSAQFLTIQQQIIDQYMQQLQSPQDQQQQLFIDQQQQQQQQQEIVQEIQKTTYDQNGLYEKWQQQCGQMLQTMPPHQSLNEPIMPELYKYFTASEEVDDPYLGQIYILTNNLNPSFRLSLKIGVIDKYQTYIQEEKILQLRKKEFTHPNLVNIHLIHTKKFLCLCFATFRICTLMDYIHDDLQQLSATKYFQEQDIWHILESITEALYLLHLKGIVHGHVSLDYILLNYLIDGTAIYKLLYKMQDITLFQLKFQYPNTNYLLAPELYRAFKQNDQTVQQTWKSDVFSLGMCLISLMLGPEQEQMNKIYQDDFNERHLHEIVKQLQDQYSAKLMKLISSMLQVEFQKRFDWVEMTSQLKSLHHPQQSHVNLIYTLEVQKRLESKLKQKTGQGISASHSKVNEIVERIQPTSTQRTGIVQETQSKIIENRTKRKIEYSDGSYYEGSLFNGMRDGLGQYYSIRQQYDGCWKNDKYHGQGTLFEDGTQLYEGGFKFGMFDGYGKMRNPTRKYLNETFNYKDFNQLGDQWIEYVGDFKNGQFNGFGTLQLSNGEKLTCVFREGLPDGVGVFETLDRRRINGQWDMGLFVRRI